MSRKQTQVGWATRTLDGFLMFWGLDEKETAYTYCEDGAEPVAVWANVSELAKHDEIQGDE